VGPMVRVIGWFAGGLWCAVVARWLWIRFGRELIGDRKMSSATFAKAVQLYGKNGAMDLVAVMSTYAVSGFYAVAVDEHMQAGKPTLPPLVK